MNDSTKPADFDSIANMDGAPAVQEAYQLIITGNGFDLACGLPSSFASFIRDRMAFFAATKDIVASNFADRHYTMTAWASYSARTSTTTGATSRGQ